MTFSVLVPYDPAWRDHFNAEREILRRVLAPWLTADVKHVGSTAIPGMSAKPVIDMIAGSPISTRPATPSRLSRPSTTSTGRTDQKPTCSTNHATPDGKPTPTTCTSPSQGAPSGRND